MTNEGVDLDKRRFLTQAAVVIGAVGTGAMAVPFISSMKPSAKAEALGAPVDVDISKIDPGQMIRVLWRGKPVWILHRTPNSLAILPTLEDQLRDPGSKESEQPKATINEYRSIKPEIFVAIGICTHLGCSPVYRPEIAPADLGRTEGVGFSVPATDHALIWRDACTNRFRHRPMVFHRITTPVTRGSLSARLVASRRDGFGKDKGSLNWLDERFP